MITVSNQVDEDPDKVFSFQIDNVNTTNVSGGIGIKFTYKIVDIDGDNEYIEEELTTEKPITFLCLAEAHCLKCENNASNCTSCDTSSNYPIYDPELH